jgi:hypothetical protein
MANIDKFNDLRKTFFIIYSDIKLNLLKNNVNEIINENILSELYNNLDIFYGKMNDIKNNSILLQGFIDNNYCEIKEVKLFLLNRESSKARDLHDKIFIKILKFDSYIPLGISHVFEDFIKGITYFSDELENKKKIPIYHRSASCSNSLEDFKEKYLQCYNTNLPEEIENKKEHIFKSYLERLIYNDILRNLIEEKLKDNNAIIFQLGEKEKNFNKYYNNIELNINIKYNNNFPIILDINYLKNNLLIKKEIFMKTTYIDEYGNTRYYEDVFHKIIEDGFEEKINIQQFIIK